MSHWMDTDRFDDDADIDGDGPQVRTHMALIFAAIESRFPHPLPRELVTRGACIDVDDPATFDPTTSAEELLELGEAAPTPKTEARRQRQAASICGGCPVRAACLADARRNTETVGIRGGVLFLTTRGVRVEHNLVDLAGRGQLSASPAGRGRTAPSAAA